LAAELPVRRRSIEHEQTGATLREYRQGKVRRDHLDADRLPQAVGPQVDTLKSRPFVLAAGRIDNGIEGASRSTDDRQTTVRPRQDVCDLRPFQR
jgi:hypothetical protein